jgi:hypothetical protein
MRIRMIFHDAIGFNFRIETMWQGHTPRIMVYTVYTSELCIPAVLVTYSTITRMMWAPSRSHPYSGWNSVVWLQPSHWVHSTPTLGRGLLELKNPAVPLSGFKPATFQPVIQPGIPRANHYTTGLVVPVFFVCRAHWIKHLIFVVVTGS